jgi:drug/metabolite transporter (DMT)-like permease
MPLAALALALAAAALHAGWNVLVAGARDVRVATTVTLALAVLVFAPVAVVTWDVEASAVPWLAASSALELVYFWLLVTAYGGSDLSLVYPIARGGAPVLVLLGSLLVGKHIGIWQGLGVALVGSGIVLVRGIRREPDRRGLALALGIAVAIAGYTLVDKEGIAHASPIGYLELVLLPAALVTLGYELGTRGSVDLRANLDWGTVGAALASFGAYALVLAALDRAAAAPVAAVRESGVLIAVGLGAVVLHEKVGWPRAAGAALVVAGVALVALT